MQPKELTKRLGINRDRIKYFKKQGVFTPELQTERGEVAEYTDRDFEELSKLVVLTKTGLTCKWIKAVKEGKCSLEEAYAKRKEEIFEEMERMKSSLQLADELIKQDTTYDALPASSLLEEIRRREAEGEVFVDIYDMFDLRADILKWPVTCPHCKHTETVDLSEYVCDETCNESQRDDDMGPDVVYTIDSGSEYYCPKCQTQLIFSGWIREYPIGAYDSADIDVQMEES